MHDTSLVSFCSKWFNLSIWPSTENLKNAIKISDTCEVFCFVLFFNYNSWKYFAQVLYKTQGLPFCQKDREIRGILLLAVVFHPHSLAYTAPSPPYRHSPRALSALGPRVHQCTPWQDADILSMGQAPPATLDWEGTWNSCHVGPSSGPCSSWTTCELWCATLEKERSS